jgi:hypothetical protein
MSTITPQTSSLVSYFCLLPIRSGRCKDDGGTFQLETKRVDIQCRPFNVDFDYGNSVYSFILEELKSNDVINRALHLLGKSLSRDLGICG